MSAKAVKKTALEKLKKQADLAKGRTDPIVSDYDGVFDSLVTNAATPAAPTRITLQPSVVPAPAVIQQKADLVPSTPQAPASSVIPKAEIPSPEPESSKENIFIQYRVGYHEHKFFNFLLEFGSVIKSQGLCQAQIAQFSGINLNTVKRLVRDMGKAGIITADSDHWHKKGVIYEPQEPFISQFRMMYGDKFPKDKKAFKAFHEARIRAEFKREQSGLKERK